MTEFDSTRLESIKSRIVVNDAIAHQPIGTCGFRKGQWTALVDGRPRKFYLSIPHGAELSDQYSRARAEIAHIIYREEASA